MNVATATEKELLTQRATGVFRVATDVAAAHKGERIPIHEGGQEGRGPPEPRL